MALGYDGKLYILAFDHRGSFQKKMLGISGTPSPDDRKRTEDAKSVIFDGMVIAAEGGEDPSVMGVLVDEESGSDIPIQARKHGLKLAMPVEKSGQDVFDFEYGDEFGDHIGRFDPDFSKVLVRHNPDSKDREANVLQIHRLRRLSDWLHDRDRKFLFELLVPAEEDQLARVDGSTDRYDAEVRPDLMRRAIAEFQDAGIEPDVWKIEGVESQADCVTLADQARSGGRDGVACVVLGRGADEAKVDQWLQAAAPVEGFVGFAIGRSIWWDALKDHLDGSLEREVAAGKIAENYLRFIEVYRAAE
ncbi:MAG: DUF2090 domain-containing protein [Nitriliruptorales bacterium]|nr:DUF2090 domain-containing protein [Nitriliruptorales bacterium]